MLHFLLCTLLFLFLQMKNMCRHRKIYDDGTGVHNGCDQRRSHDGRIQMYLLCQQWKDTADEFCNHDGGNQGKPDDYCHLQVMINQENPKSVCQCQCKADQQGDTEFLEHDFEHVFKMNLI